jgi:hypothetical protein
MTPRDLAAILRTVPEKRLHVIALAWEVTDRQGKVDHEQAMQRMDAILDAASEAHAYARTVGSVRDALRRLMHPEATHRG